MILQADLLLGNVKFLNIIDEFLLKAVLIIVHLFDFGQSIQDAPLDLVDARLLLARHLVEKGLYCINFLLKEYG